MTPYVHLAPTTGEGWWQFALRRPDELSPQMPFPDIHGRYPVWFLEHKGHELFFASPDEISHVIDVLSQKVLPSPCSLGARYQAVNRHWLSRLHKNWKPWSIRQRMVKKLGEALL